MKIFSVTVRNYNTERTTSKDFTNESDAIKYAKLQMKRKIGPDYLNKVRPFKGRIFDGYYYDMYEIYILQKTKNEGDPTTYVECINFEL